MIDHSMGRNPQEVGNVKRWEDKVENKRMQDTFTYNKNDTNTDPLSPQLMKPNSLHPTYIYICLKEGVGS